MNKEEINIKKDFLYWIRKSNFVVQPIVIIYCIINFDFMFWLIPFAIIFIIVELINTKREMKNRIFLVKR